MNVRDNENNRTYTEEIKKHTEIFNKLFYIFDILITVWNYSKTVDIDVSKF